MRIMIAELFAAGLTMLAAVPVMASPKGLYTDTDGRNCLTIRQESALSIWRCDGPAGYSALFSDEGNIVDVEYGQAGREKGFYGLQWRGADNPVGPRIEWRLASGIPFAAILRINSLDVNDRAASFLLIARVTPKGSCRIALVNARHPDANLRARRIADMRGPTYACME